jgi:paraquat-inducible protein A
MASSSTLVISGQAAAPAKTAARLRECRDCGLLQIVPSMTAGERALCLRCDATLRHTRQDPVGIPLVLNLSALVLLLIGAFATLMSVSTAGQHLAADLFSGPAGLEKDGAWELAGVVLLTTFVAPLAKLLGLLTVLIGLRLPHPPRLLPAIFAWVERLRPWSMIDVYLLGVFVAFVRLSAMAQIEIGIALFALAALMVTMASADFLLDPQAVWEEMERRRGLEPRPDRGGNAGGAQLRRLGCESCGLVSRASPGRAQCPRCGFVLRDRKPNSVALTWALLISALILYAPANAYPVLTIVQVGSNQSTTILGGAEELLQLGEWPLAALVFFASIAVPVLKLIGLSFLLITTQLHYGDRLRERTRLFRIIRAIGRWSMIDVFMESILVALVQFGSIATVTPGRGAVAFASVVILTMFAAQSFDPRLMWDAAGMNGSE